MNEIKLQKRTLLKRKAKQLLEEGMLPGVIYNSKGDSTNVKLPQGETERLLQTSSTSTILDIDLEGQNMKGVVKEIDVDPVKGTLRHIAFFEIDPNEENIFEIPVVLVGVSNAVKNSLGVLVQPTMSLELKCRLADVVEKIEIDISGLDNPGDTITLDDIELPKGTSLPNEDQANTALATITELQKLEILTEDEEGAEAEPELDEEGNPIEEEEGAEGEEEAESAE